MKYDHVTIREVNGALLDAFLLPALERVLDEGMGLSREHLSLGGDLKQVVFEVTREINKRERIGELMAAALAANPTNSKLMTAADKVLQPLVRSADRNPYERLLADAAEFTDPAQARSRQARAEGQIGRIEIAGSGAPLLATGFLIGPDLVLTNHHVIEDLLAARRRPQGFQIRFDFRVQQDLTVVVNGVCFGLAHDWLVDASPASRIDWNPDTTEEPNPEHLDYAVLRLAEPAGEHPRSPMEGSPDAPPRGWFRLVERASLPAPGSPLLILQHPGGDSLRLAYGAVLSINGNGTRIRHSVNTLPGSSGSPCFDAAYRLVALHHGSDTAEIARFNQAVPIGAVATLLRRKGVDEAEPARA